MTSEERIELSKRILVLLSEPETKHGLFFIQHDKEQSDTDADVINGLIQLAKYDKDAADSIPYSSINEEVDVISIDDDLGFNRDEANTEGFYKVVVGNKLPTKGIEHFTKIIPINA